MIIFNSQNIYSMYSGDQKKILAVYRGSKKVFPPNKETVVLSWKSGNITTNNYSKPWNNLTDIPTFSISKEAARQYISFSSTDTSIASVDSSGNISLTGTIGNCNIIASMSSNNYYQAANAVISINVTKQLVGLKWSVSSLSMDWDKLTDAPTFSIDDDSKRNLVQFTSSNPSIATVDLNGNITINKNITGETKITATLPGDSLTYSYAVTTVITINKISPNLRWNTSYILIHYSKELDEIKLINPFNIDEIYYSSQDDTYISADSYSGKLTLIKARDISTVHSCDIYAYFPGNELYTSWRGTCKITTDMYQKLYGESDTYGQNTFVGTCIQNEMFHDGDYKGYYYIRAHIGDLTSIIRNTSLLHGTLRFLDGFDTITNIHDNVISGLSKVVNIDLSGFTNVTSIGAGFLRGCTSLKAIIINNSNKVISLPLEKAMVTPEVIYVNDELIEQYKEAVPKFADAFRPLSEYKS